MEGEGEEDPKVEFIGPEQTPLLVHDTRREQLKAIKRIAVSGVGFFSDAYDLFIINIVMVIMEKIHEMQPTHKSALSSAALWGAVVGQLFFGLLADKIGRKKGFIATLTLVVLGAIASAAAFKTSYTSIFVSLAVFRFILGIGIGGEYPLSATITAESAKTTNRGRMTAAVFSMQGIGSFVAALMGFILITTLGNKDLDLVWRLCLAFGAVPGILSMYFRITMEETDRFKHKNETSYKHILKTYWKPLLGTAGNWFLLDVVFYANGLFSSTILDSFNIGEQTDILQALLSTSKFNIYLTLMALPGYWVGIFLIELKYFGRRNTQIFGFITLGATYFLLGGLFFKLQKIPWLFVLVYGITFFFTNAGANTTTFVLPSETFPTEVRATCHGLSAAAGKLGAVVGSAAMAPVLNKWGLDVVFYVCGGVALLGSVVTFFFTKETKGLSLEQIAENQERKEGSSS